MGAPREHYTVFKTKQCLFKTPFTFLIWLEETKKLLFRYFQSQAASQVSHNALFICIKVKMNRQIRQQIT